MGILVSLVKGMSVNCCKDVYLVDYLMIKWLGGKRLERSLIFYVRIVEKFE